MTAERHSTTILTSLPDFSRSPGSSPLSTRKRSTRPVGDRHAGRQLLDRVAGLDVDHLEAQRLGVLDLGEAHAAERAERIRGRCGRRFGCGAWRRR